jgi:MFS transporter, DHA2 family, multidrug resistance protein
MSSAAPIAASDVALAPRVNPWIVGLVVSLAAFMEVLDSSIANVALPHIAGSLGTSNDESTWVLTSYLVANAIVLPISGFLVSALGRKRSFVICIASFSASSLLCGIAPTLSLLLLFRICQGAFGGGLQPMAQAILADVFPENQRGLAFALYGVAAVCGPVLGPTLGGWITDNSSWRWIFYINVPVGALTSLLVHLLVEDPPYLIELRNKSTRFDLIGFSLLTVAVASFQVMLDKGQEDDWFGSRFITTLAVVAVTGIVALVIWEWRRKEPIVDIHLFSNVNFATTSLMFLLLGAALFSSTVLMPQFLQTLLGYTAEDAGLVLSAGAIVILFCLPLAGQLTTRVQARYLIAFGWIALAGGMYISVWRTDLLVSFGVEAWLRILQSYPIPFLFVPLTLVGYLGLPADKTSSAAGLMNFMRNIGQSIGTSATTTMLARRRQYHQLILASSTATPQFVAAIRELAMRLNHVGLDMHTAGYEASARLYDMLLAQAAALSYVDAYWLLAAASITMCFASFLLKANDPRKSKNPSVH